MDLAKCLELLGSDIPESERELIVHQMTKEGKTAPEAVLTQIQEVDNLLDQIAKTVESLGRPVVRIEFTPPRVSERTIQRVFEMSPEQLVSLEDLATAEEAVGRIPETDPNDPSRRAMQERIADELYGKGAKNKDRQVWMVLGPPASGKSSLVEGDKGLAKKKGALIVDSDMAKVRIPEFRDGIGANAVHQESKKIAADVLARAIENGDNIVEPLVGANAEKVKKKIAKYKELGYEVHIRLVDLPVDKTLQRATARYYSSHRFVPMTYILDTVGYGPVETYKQLLKEHVVNDIEAYSSDVPRGSQPEKIEDIEAHTAERTVPTVVPGSRFNGRGLGGGNGAAEETQAVKEFNQETLTRGPDAEKIWKDFLYADVGHKREKKSGRYVGGPSGVGASPRSLAKLRKTLGQLALDGVRGRFWYERSSRAILEITGGDLEEAERLVSLIALYSPHATVAANTSMALTAYYQWKAGKPINAGTSKHDAKAEAYLRENKDWQGRKTNNFYRNLMIEIDPSRVDTTKSTMDMWMAVAFDYGSGELDQGPMYDFAEKEIDHLAQYLGWSAHQVQAAIWTAARARWEEVKDRVLEEELRKGIRVREEKTDPETGKVKIITPFAKKEVKRGNVTVLTDAESRRKHYHLAHKRMMEVDLNPEEVGRASYDFSNALLERTVQMSWEAMPSFTLNDVPGLERASYRDQMDYLISVTKALTNEDGKDMIADAVGLVTPKRLTGPSAWESHVGAGAQDFIPVPLEGQKTQRKVKAQARELLDLYAALRGLVLHQDAVVWHVPIYGGSIQSHNGFELRGSRTIDEVDVQELYRAIEDEFGIDEIAPGFAGDRVRVLNFVEDEATKKNPRQVKLHFNGLVDVFFRDENWKETRVAKTKYTYEKGVVTLKDGVDVPEGSTLVVKLSNKDFQARMNKVVERLPDDWGGGSLQHAHYRSDGNYIGNDWRRNKSGKEYRDYIKSRRPDLLRKARDLRARVEEVNREYRSRIRAQMAVSGSGDVPVSGRGAFATDAWVGPDGLIPLTHWSKVPGLTELDPKMAGTAAAGRERHRVSSETEGRIYFGLPGYQVEPSVKAVARYRYFTKVDPKSLYDLEGDPENLRAQILERKKAAASDPRFAQTVNANDIEVMIKRLGYKGYWVEKPIKAAVMFEPVPVTEVHGVPGDTATWDAAGTKEFYQSNRPEINVGTPQVRETYPPEQENNDHPQGKQAPGVEPAPGVPAQSQAEIRDNFRVRYEQVPVGTLHTGLERVTTMEEAAHVLAPIRKHAQETMMALVLDDFGKILNVIRHTKGAKDASSVDVGTLVAAIGSTPGAAKVWFAHNHPSGIAEPSSEDIKVTRVLDKALDGSGVEVQGHVVLASGGDAYGFTPYGGVSKIHIKPAVRSKQVDITERVLRKTKMKDAPTIDSPNRAKEIAADFDTATGVMLLDNRHRVLGLLEMADKDMARLRGGKQIPRLLTALDASNAAAVIVIADSQDAARNIGNYIARLNGIRHLDSLIKPVGVAEPTETGRIVSLAAEGADLGNAAAEFYQPHRGSLAVMPDGKRILRLGEASDLSTFLHESAHLFLEFEAQLAGEFGVSENQRAMLDWLGVASFDQITPEMHERWAETFEAYLRTGKAPSSRLQGAFDTFKEWLLGIYKTLKDPRLSRVDLSPDISAVFDRLLASQEEIERVSAGEEYQELFRDPERAGMTDDEWARLQAQREKAKKTGQTTLDKQLLSQLRKRREAEWAEARAPVIKRFKALFAEMPIYRLFDQLTKTPLDQDQVIATMGSVPRRLKPYVAKNGINVEEIAGTMGFQNARALLESMVNTPSIGQAAFAAAEAELIKQKGDMLNDGTIEQEAQMALHNEEQAKALLMELKALNRKAPSINRDVLKREAKAAIAKLTYRSIHPSVYHKAEVRAAQEAKAAKTPEAAYSAKLKQLANFYLFKEAMKARTDAEKIRKYVRDVQTREYSAKQVHPQYIHYMKMLARAYEMRAAGTPKDKARAAQNLAEVANWMRSQINEVTGMELAIYDPNAQALLDAQEAGKLGQFQMKNWDDMSIEELRAIRLQLKHLRFVGGQNAQETRIRIAEQGRAAAESIRENAPHWTSYWEKDKLVSKIKDLGLNYGTSILFNAETLLRRLDGFKAGPMVQGVLRPIHEALNNKLQPALDQAAEEMDAIMHRHYTDAEMREMNTVEDFDGLQLSHWQRIMVLMNWGTESNRQAILDSTIQGTKPFTPERVQKIIESLDENDVQFVQDVLNHVNQFRAPLFELQRRLTGVAPPAVEAVPIETPYGVIPGGYFPLHYDKKGSWRMTEIDMDSEAKSMRAGNFASAQTKHGMAMARVGSGGNPVLLDISVWQRHVIDVLRHIHLAEAINQAEAILTNKEVAQAINETGNQDLLAALDIWIKDVAAGDIVSYDAINRIFRRIRTGVSVVGMGFNIGTMLVQPLGLFQTMPVVGYRSTMNALLSWILHPVESSRMVQALSPFMRDRSRIFNKDIYDTLREIHGRPGSPGHMPRWFTKSIFAGIVWTQRMVDTVTWLAVYDGKKGTMDESDLIFEADRAVARSQASGVWGDRTPVERGTAGVKVRQTEIVKVWSAFGSYMFAKANVFSEVIGRTNFHNPKDVVKFAIDTMSLFVVEAVITGLLRGTFPDDDDEESRAAWIAKEGMFSVLSTVPVVREFGSELQGFRGQSAVGRGAESFGKMMKQIAQMENDPAAWRAALNFFGIVLKLPVAPVNRVIDAAARDAEGEDITWPDYIIWRERKK